MGLFDRLLRGLAKTSQAISDAVSAAAGRRALDPELAARLEAALLAADLGPELCGAVLQDLRAGAGKGEAVREALRASLLERLGVAALPRPGLLTGPKLAPCEVTLMVGVNGSGKTTSSGKLAAHWAARGEKILLVGADTFRAAAVEQLREWAKRSGAEFYSQKEGADPAAVAFDAVGKALAGGVDRVLIDTAGRLQTKAGLMEELKKVHRVCAKALAGAPHRSLLVLDASSGQNMLSQARLFAEAVPLSGLIVTKLDGTSKGGALLQVLERQRLPVELIGVGEALEDLQEFDPEAYVRALVA